MNYKENPTSLSDNEIVALRPIMDELAAKFDAVSMRAPWSELTYRASDAQYPCLHIDDVSGIPFVLGVPGVEEYQHRARARARTGDVFAAVTPPAPGYERYNERVLGLGSPTFALAEARDGSMAVADACLNGAAFDAAVVAAKRAGGLVVHPYMGIASTWHLAAKLAEASDVRVSLLGPPPPVLWIANDKAAFAAVVASAAGPDWNVETHICRTAEQLAAHLTSMAGRHAAVAIKRTRCASAMGNKRLDSAAVRAMSPKQVVRCVQSFLVETEWDGQEEVLAVAWEDTAISPSTQLWIPPAQTGAPFVDGVYEQVLEGPERSFVGSRPSTLPAAVNGAIAKASLRIAHVFQALGYVGRCSFDFIVGGDPSEDPVIRCTECNGRWGGTSTPMHIIDRVRRGPRPHYWAQDYMHPSLAGRPFDDVLAAVSEHLFRSATQTGRFLFYNVGPLAKNGKLDIISIGDSPEDAEAGARELLPRLLGIASGR